MKKSDNESPSVLRVRDLCTYFYTDQGVATAVDGVSFDLRPGRTLALVGESGCGKSVTALSILRLVPSPPGRIVSGEILFDGQDLVKLSEPDMRTIRGNDISMIFQEPMTAMNPVFRVGNQIAAAIRLHRNVSKAVSRKEAVALLERVGIPAPAQRIDDYPHQMSGGMLQRVMIAMALACKPKVLIADEPTTALDVTIQAQILDLLNVLQQETGMAILLITHDLGVVAEAADDVVIMYAGKKAEQAPTEEILSDKPLHPYTHLLLASLPSLHTGDGPLPTIPGTVPSATKFPEGCRFRTRCPFAMDVCRQEPPFQFAAEDHGVACWLHDAPTMQAQGRPAGIPEEALAP